MIHFRELREFPVKSLRLPGDFRKRYSAQHIGQLAERMKHRGQVTPLLVRGTTVLDGIDRCTQAGIEPTQMQFFVLIGFDTTPEQDLERVTMLADRGCMPYVMPFNRADPYQAKFARWVNHRAIFNTVKWEEYK